MPQQINIQSKIIELIIDSIHSVEKKAVIISTKVGPTTKLKDIGCDSLNKLEIAMNVQEKYDVLILNETWDAFETVQDVMNCVPAASVAA